MEFRPLPAHVAALLRDCASYTIRLRTPDQFDMLPEKDVLSRFEPEILGRMLEAIAHEEVSELRLLSLREPEITNDTVVPILGVKNGQLCLLETAEFDWVEWDLCMRVLRRIAEKRKESWSWKTTDGKISVALAAGCVVLAAIASYIMFIHPTATGGTVAAIAFNVLMAAMALGFVFVPKHFWNRRAQRIENALAEMPTLRAWA